MKTLQFILSIPVICLFFACGKDSTAPINNESAVTPKPELEQQISADLAYGTNVRNKMDVYLPAKRDTTTPFILLMHGGSWTSGDKKEVTALQQNLIAQGIASANINYRFAAANFPIDSMMTDVSKALAYCQTKASAWGVNVSKIGIGGFSSGAHMAMLYALRYDTENRIDCIISAAGPTVFDNATLLNDAVKNNGIGILNTMAGAVYVPGSPISAKFTAASPLRNLNKNIPTLFIHGTADMVVPYEQSVLMKNAMDEKKYTDKLVTITGAGHDLNLGDAATAKTFLDEIVAWIRTYETR